MENLEKKYNILFITSDQQHFNTIGKFNPEIHTPNLDRLCDQGTYYNRAYTVNPTCTPARASLITGKYPSQHGAWTLGTKLSEQEPTIGAMMQKKGIKTALIGKAHFQPLKSTEKYCSLEAYPLLQDLEFWKNYQEDFYGFKTVRLARNHTTESHVGQHYALWLEEKGCLNWRDYFEAPTGNMGSTEQYAWKLPEEYHYDAWIAEETNKLLEQYKENGDTFFLWSSFFDPHPRYFVPQNYVDLYDADNLTLPCVVEGEHDDSPEIIKKTQELTANFSEYQKSGFLLHGTSSHKLKSEKTARKDLAIYYSMITLMDKYIGKILDKLEELGLRENTIVVYTTDHGHFLGQHGLYAKGPFMYEDAVRVPYIVSCPGTIPCSKVSKALQSLVDLPVTFLDYSNIDIPYYMTGINQRKVWEGLEESARKHVIVEHHHEKGSINLRAYINDRYKLVVSQYDKYWELYDLKDEPCEIMNHWNDLKYCNVKFEIMQEYIQAELEKESLYMPRIADA